MAHNEIQFKMIDHDAPFIDGVNPLVLQDDPDNWKTIQRVIKRSTKTFGVVTELSDDLDFIGDGAEFLRRAFLTRDVEANVTLQEWRQHPREDRFYLHSSAPFDFMKYKNSDFRVSIPFKTSGLNAEVKAQMRKKFEMDRSESLKETEITPIGSKTFALTSREILLISELASEPSRDIDQPGSLSSMAVVPKLNVISNSDPANVFQTLDFDELYWLSGGGANENDANLEQMFYANSDVAKTLKLRLKFRIRSRKGGFNNSNYGVKIYRYNAPGITHVSNQTLLNIPFQSSSLWVEYDQEIILNVNQGDYFRLGFLTAFGDGTSSSATATFEIDYIELVITEESIRDDSQSKALMMHEIGDQLLKIISGEEGSFYSEYYGRTEIGYSQDGEFSYTALALGFWIRQFNEKKFSISLDEWLKTSNCIHNTGYTIDTHNGKEALIVEDMKFFFQEQSIIDLGEVTNEEEEVAEDFYNSGTEFGYKKPNAETNTPLYEEAMGLDEYNTRRSWTLPTTRTDTTYDKICPCRADNYGKEFARRKPKINFPEEDTKYDDEKFILDGKKGQGDVLLERTWEDDFEQPPQNVFSPATATNLRLTPFRISERHQWFYRAPFVKDFFSNKKVAHASSVGNDELITKKVGEPERSERVSLLINETETPRFTGMYVTFIKPIDYDINEMLMGKTEVNGRMIPNYFFRVKYKYRGVVKYGYIIEVQPQNNTWKLLKAI